MFFIKTTPFDFKLFRKNILGIDKKVSVLSGKTTRYIHFDNAASTPALLSVFEECKEAMAWYAAVHRGSGHKSQYSSQAYESAHEVIADFLQADLEKNTLIFVKNTTEAINKLANRLDLSPNDVVISTLMEHHSNDLPWRKKAKLIYAGLDSLGRLDLNDLEKKLKTHSPKVKLVSVCGASNVTGHINDIYKIARMAHNYGAEIMLDAAQLIPHQKIDMKANHDPEHIDYLAFSGHKIYAPFGIGVLVAKKETFLKGEPDYSGGGTVKLVSPDHIYWADLPHKEEAGTPNVFGAIALANSIQYLQTIGMEKIAQYEDDLLNNFLKKINQIPGITIYGTFPRVGVISFNMQNMPHNLLGSILYYEGGIGVRTGCFCAQTYVRNLLKVKDNMYPEKYLDHPAKMPGMLRISLAAFNTTQEIDVVISLLSHISKHKKLYLSEYYYSEKSKTYLPRWGRKISKSIL